MPIEPTRDRKIPFNIDKEPEPSLLEQLAVAGNTAALQAALGAPIEMSLDDAKRAKNLIKEVVKDGKTKHLTEFPVALGALEFIRSYSKQLAMDAAQIRVAVTNKLLEIANCGDTKYELRALELLGKHSDVGLFTERSEITINHRTPEALEEAIKERVKRLLHTDIIDITPLSADLDAELGFSPDEEAEEENEPLTISKTLKTEVLSELKDVDDWDDTDDWDDDLSKWQN